MIEGIAYLLAVDMPANVLRVEKLEMPVDKNLVNVETYLLKKLGRWDFVDENKSKILFVKYGV